MRGDATQSALAEIALALAMCFFSIAIVSLVSMAVPAATANTARTPEASSPPFPKVTLASAVGEQDKAPMPSDMTLVVHDGTSFRDAELNALNTDSLDPATPVLLAVPPSVGIEAAAALRSKIAADSVVVTALDAAWLQALREHGQ